MSTRRDTGLLTFVAGLAALGIELPPLPPRPETAPGLPPRDPTRGYGTGHCACGRPISRNKAKCLKCSGEE